MWLEIHRDIVIGGEESLREEQSHMCVTFCLFGDIHVQMRNTSMLHRTLPHLRRAMTIQCCSRLSLPLLDYMLSPSKGNLGEMDGYVVNVYAIKRLREKLSRLQPQRGSLTRFRDSGSYAGRPANARDTMLAFQSVKCFCTLARTHLSDD